MIDERAHGNLRHQLGESANVVCMVVGQQQVIDLAHARIFGRGYDAVSIQAVVPCPAGIDQQRLPCRGDKERRLTAVHIDEVNLERMALCRLRSGQHRPR